LQNATDGLGDVCLAGGTWNRGLVHGHCVSGKNTADIHTQSHTLNVCQCDRMHYIKEHPQRQKLSCII